MKWKLFKDEFDIKDFHGFCYLIINKQTGQKYIGKKSFWSVRRVKVKDRKNRKIIRKESDWKTYTGSSRWLNEDIDQYGIDNFEFIMLSMHESKAALSYREIELQIKLDVLRAKLDDGSPMYYNRQILGSIKFIPPDATPKELKYRNHFYI